MTRLHTILAVARREFEALAADRWTTAAVTVMPLVVGLVLTCIYQYHIVRDVPTLVIDHDHSATSRALIRALDANESLAVTRVISDGTGTEGALRDAKCACAIDIPRDFERELLRGRAQTILCTVNGSNVVIANYALKGVSTVVGTISAGVGMSKLEKNGTPGSSALLALAPIAITSRTIFNPGQSYADFFLPGILAALLQQIIVVSAALTWVREFRTGSIAELRGSASGLLDMFAGKLLIYLTIGAAWSAILFVGMMGIVDVPFTGSVLAGGLLLVLLIAAMSMLAMMISSLVEHRETAMQMVFIVSSPAFLLSGYTFPQMAMTPMIRWIGMMIPLTPFLVGWRRVVLYGAGFENIGTQVLTLLAMCGVFGAIAVIVVRRKLSRLSSPEVSHV